MCIFIFFCLFYVLFFPTINLSGRYAQLTINTRKLTNKWAHDFKNRNSWHCLAKMFKQFCLIFVNFHRAFYMPMVQGPWSVICIAQVYSSIIIVFSLLDKLILEKCSYLSNTYFGFFYFPSFFSLFNRLSRLNAVE